MVNLRDRWISLIAVAAAGVLSVGVVPGLGTATAWAAEPRCVVMRTEPGGTVLYNLCGVCRSAKVEHRRPGDSFPVHRDYAIPSQGRAQLSFRGGGQTRILSEVACAGGANPDVPQTEAPQCIALQHTPQAGPLAINTCNDCRLAEIERVNADGSRSRLSVAVDGRSYAPVKADGAVEARLIGERPCR